MALSQFVSSIEPGDLPKDVLHCTKRAILDLLGCGLAASSSIEVHRLTTGMLSYDRGNECLIWGTERRVSQPMAAMVNSTSAHARELDDCGGPGHVGTVVIPAALAVAEANHLDGLKTLTAVALGYEVLFRVTDAIGGFAAVLEPGWHPIAVVGAFGSATAAGWLLDLSEEQLMSALGLAGSYSGGVYAFLADGSMAKRWHAGRAAISGLEAGYLARAGFTGPRAIFGLQWGSFFRTHFPATPVRPQLMSEALGVEYRMTTNFFKAYPCCWGIHPYIEGLLPIMDLHQPALETVESIDVYCSASTAQRIGRPGSEVDTTLDAQLSLPYSLAALLVNGHLTLAEYEDEVLTDPRIRALARRIRVVPGGHDEGQDRMVIRLQDGSCIPAATAHPRGSPERPMTDEELQAKFHGLAAPAIGSERSQRLADMIWNLEDLADSADLTAMMRSTGIGGA